MKLVSGTASRNGALWLWPQDVHLPSPRLSRGAEPAARAVPLGNVDADVGMAVRSEIVEARSGRLANLIPEYSEPDRGLNVNGIGGIFRAIAR